MKNTLRSLLKNTVGADLIEYALLAGFLACTAGFALPSVNDHISTIFSKVQTYLTDASDQGDSGTGHKKGR